MLKSPTGSWQKINGKSKLEAFRVLFDGTVATAIDRLRRRDHAIELEHDNRKIALRVLKFRLKGGEEETLITDIQDKKQPRSLRGRAPVNLPMSGSIRLQ